MTRTKWIVFWAFMALEVLMPIAFGTYLSMQPGEMTVALFFESAFSFSMLPISMLAWLVVRATGWPPEISMLAASGIWSAFDIVFLIYFLGIVREAFRHGKAELRMRLARYRFG